MRSSSLLCFSLTLLACISLATTCRADLTGLWDFENAGDLTAANTGNGLTGTDLTLVGSDLAVAGSGTGLDAGATAVGDGSHYIVNHGAAPNGGGSGVYVNEFTILWDIYVPAASGNSWVTFWQSSTTNSNDGDLFRRPDGGSNPGKLGTFDTNYSGNALALDTWARVVLSVDNDDFFKLYVDGNEWLDGVSQPTDGRFSLDPVFLALADNDGDDGLVYLSNLAVWDEALGANAITNLGGAGRPIGIPEPASWAMLGMAMCIIGRRRTR